MSKSLAAVDVLSGKRFDLQIRADYIPTLPVSGESAETLYVSPGWIDLQVNGFAGHDLNCSSVSVDDIKAMTACLWKEGVTAWCPTLISGPTGQVEHTLEIINQACRQDPQIDACVAGIHLEGPYISSGEGTHGAHPLQYIHAPDWEEFTRWQMAAGGRIRLVTLAPELPGAIEFIYRLVENGVIVGLGHTRASTTTIREAVEAGARLATHLGNGIESTLHRHPNPIWDQLAEDRLWASLIFDGFHLPANVMKVLLRAKGLDHCLLISDASTLARQQPGVYDTPVGGKVQLFPSGRLSIFGTEYLAGSASSVKDGVENAIRLAGCTLTEAIRLATINPGTLLGLKQNAKTYFTIDPQNDNISILGVSFDDKIVYQNLYWEL